MSSGNLGATTDLLALLAANAEHAARCRLAAQQIIEAIGSVGPESVEQAVSRALARLAAVERERDEARADAASWLSQCEQAREDALTYGRERDEARAEVERLRATLAKVRPDVCREESIDDRLSRHLADQARIDAATEQIDALEGRIAALREADREYDAAYYALTSTHRAGSPEAARVGPRMVEATERRKAALADTRAAAEAYRARVRAEVLVEARTALGAGGAGYFTWSSAIQTLDRLLGVEPCTCALYSTARTCPQHGDEATKR